MGLEVLDLSCYTGKGTSDDADFAPRLDIRLIDFKRDAQALHVFTRLGIDEILHLLLGDRDNLTLLFPTPLGLDHKLNRQEIRIRVFEFTDNLLLVEMLILPKIAFVTFLFRIFVHQSITTKNFS